MICCIFLLAAGAVLSLVTGRNCPKDPQTGTGLFPGYIINGDMGDNSVRGAESGDFIDTHKNCCSDGTSATVTATVTDCGETATTTVAVTTAGDTVTSTVTSTITTVDETVTETITDTSIITETTMSTFITTTCNTMGNGGPEKRRRALATTF